MTDSLGFRLKLGVIVPSTNTSAQPEMDGMRPRGVTNHFGRMVINDDSMVEEPGFNHVMRSIRNSTEAAAKSVVSCNPDRLIVGVSPESYWDGPGSDRQVVDYMQSLSGGIPVTMSPDAIRAALSCYDHITRIAVITPYLPVGDQSVRRFFTDSGYDVVALQGLDCHSPARIAHASERQLRDAIKEVDKHEPQAIVQVGTNLAMSRVAAMAEFWLGKPVIANNTVLYWHALRQGGIQDQLHGFGSLLAEH